MASEVISAEDLKEPIIRRKRLTAHNHGDMMTVIDTGEFGVLVTDEPVAHGGTGEGPSPLQTVLGALCGCEAVTFNRTAAEMDFAYEGSNSRPSTPSTSGAAWASGGFASTSRPSGCRQRSPPARARGGCARSWRRRKHAVPSTTSCRTPASTWRWCGYANRRKVSRSESRPASRYRRSLRTSIRHSRIAVRRHQRAAIASRGSGSSPSVTSASSDTSSSPAPLASSSSSEAKSMSPSPRPMSSTTR